MSVTGIVLFVIFLLVKSLLDKKKKETRRQKAPESSASPDEMGGTAETTQVMAENPTEVRDLLRRFLDERAAAVETSDVPSEALSEIESASAARSPASLRHAENRGEKLQNLPEEAVRPRALALDLASAGLLQAVVLAEIIGRPKAQRRQSPYFRP